MKRVIDFKRGFLMHEAGVRCLNEVCVRGMEVAAERECRTPTAGKRWQGVALSAHGQELRPYALHAGGRVAHIDAGGVVIKRFGADEMDWGMLHDLVLDLDMLDAALEMVAADERVETVVLELDTPGGAVTGVVETAKRIEQMSASGKDVVGFTEMMACSAGYWLLAACDGIAATPSATVGSIGAYIGLYDFSKLLDELGVEAVLARSGSLKGLGFYGKPVTEEERAFLQGEAVALGEEFKGYVQANRGGAVPDEAMEGQSYDAVKGMGYGLVDVLANSRGEMLEVLGAWDG